MSAVFQERIAFFIVGLTCVYLIWNWLGNWIRHRLATWLLSKGRVKWAMKLRPKGP